jgi:hypothetical protein
MAVVIIPVPHLFYTLRVWKILQNHRSPFVFARSAAQKWKGKVRQPTETHLSPGGFLKKRELRVPETAVDTQLGLGQVRSGSGISTFRGFANVLFFLLLKPSRNEKEIRNGGEIQIEAEETGKIERRAQNTTESQIRIIVLLPVKSQLIRSKKMRLVRLSGQER